MLESMKSTLPPNISNLSTSVSCALLSYTCSTPPRATKYCFFQLFHIVLFFRPGGSLSM